MEFADRSELQALAEKIDKRITTLAHSFETGRALKNGIPVAIIGKTNVGKSTLLNQLLHEEKAIVSDIDGTTRDVIEDTIDIHGVNFRFIDTAGIRQTEDKVEQIGIKRAYQKLEEATIVLWILDNQPSKEEVLDIQNRTKEKQVIILSNKMDIKPQSSYNFYDFRPFAEEFGNKYKNDKVIYVASSGPTQQVAYTFSSFIFMEMQWIDSGSFSTGEFFHGPFELVEKDKPYLLLVNDGPTRQMDLRALTFLKRFDAKVTVVDAKDYGLDKYVSASVKEYFNPILIDGILRLYGESIAEKRQHPLTMRRYMWKLEY